MHKISLVLGLAAALLSSSAFAQSQPKKYLSVSGTNSNLVRAGSSVLTELLPINTTTTTYYLKFYNKATAPTCGTDVPVWTVPVPAASSSSPNGVALPSAMGLLFPLGLGFCLTSGIADADTGAAAAGVAINLGVRGS
jgi:hypothetical protein